MSHWVRLAPSDIEHADRVAERRNRDNLENAHGLEAGRSQSLALHRLGCYGEIAFAVLLKVPWRGDVDTFKTRADVGGAEVRTRSKAHYDLIHRRDDDPAKRYVHVNGADPPWMEVVGWILGSEARRDCWLASHGGREAAWFVPRSALRPVRLVR